MKKHLRLALKILSAFFILSAIFLLILRFSPYPALREFRKHPVSTRIFDCRGNLIQIHALENGVRREFVPLDEIPGFVTQAFIDGEDRHFYSHHGIDFAAIVRAAFQNTKELRTVSGASTITMQLARMIRPNKNRTILVKMREAFDALRLEARLSKKEILEAYLNNVPFGFNADGVASAVRTFFSKNLSELTEDEARCLSVSVRRPALYNPFEVSETARAFSYPFEMPHFVRYLSNLPDSPIGRLSEVQTTADLSIQHHAEDLLSSAVAQYGENRLSNGAILVCDTQTGAILAWVGSADFFDEAHNGQVDGVLSFRQPGSSMKPFLYALALESGFMPSSVLPDIPMEFGFENLYVPQNFNNRFNGPVRFRVALASSLNIPAVYLLNEIGLDSYLKKLSSLGFKSLEDSDPGLSVALGSAEVSIFEMTQAFSVFARDGVFIPLWAIDDERFRTEQEKAEEKQVFDVNTVRIISDILSDKDARALGFGYSQTFQTPFPAMFKTGTANQYQNITALGSTPHYTVGVWMGNFSGETVIGKTGSSIPAKIAREILVGLQGNSGKDFKKPAQFKKERICALSGLKAGENCPDTVKEFVPVSEKIEKCGWHTQNGTNYPAQYATWFRLKNRSGQVSEKGTPLKIVSPRNGSLFYYDDSVPLFRQKLVVEATGGSEDEAEFFVDGKLLGKTARPFVQQVPIERGEHQIQVQCGEESSGIVIAVK